MLAKRRSDPFQLEVGMAGVKLGDRVAQIACEHGGRLGAIAAKVGLSGHAAVVVDNAGAAARAEKGAAQAGVFIEIHQAASTDLPLQADSFDLLIVDDTAGFFAKLSEHDRARTVLEAVRILRPGGRAMIVQSLPARGLGALLQRGPSGPPFDPRPSLEANGFKLTRLLGEGEGLRFVEGVKPRNSVS